MARVALIIPCYNVRPFVSEAIDSALKQDFHDIDIIAVDDGSTDGTLEVLERFRPTIQVITQQNKGPASARNAGIYNSDSEYVAFLDADDLMERNRISLEGLFSEKCTAVYPGGRGRAPQL